MRDLFEVERFTLPSPSSLLVQEVYHLTITVMVQQRIDLGDHVRLCLPQLSDGQGLFQGHTTSGTTAETHIDLDHFAANQGHIFNEQAENAFPFARFDCWIIPYPGK